MKEDVRTVCKIVIFITKSSNFRRTCTYNLHFKNNVANTMPMKVTPTHDDIRIRSHVSSNTVPEILYYISSFRALPSIKFSVLSCRKSVCSFLYSLPTLLRHLDVLDTFGAPITKVLTGAVI